jgi:hypothetical protein
VSSFAGRARLITHLLEAWGEEGAVEHGFEGKPSGFEPLLVFEVAPQGERAWWTYTTAGLSLCSALDGCAPMELMAYAEEQSPGLVDVLFQLALRESPAAAYAVGDVASFDADPPDLGIPLGRHFGLVSPREESAVLRFPDVTVRAEDQRYILARSNEDDGTVRFMRVIALRAADSLRSPATLEAAQSHAWDLY